MGLQQHEYTLSKGCGGGFSGDLGPRAMVIFNDCCDALIICNSTDMCNNENFAAFSLVFFGSLDAGKVDIAVSCLNQFPPNFFAEKGISNAPGRSVIMRYLRITARRYTLQMIISSR